MAYLSRKTLAGDTFPYLLLHHSVGPHSINRPDDVQLVQFLINQAHASGPFPFELEEPLRMDGICGPKTKAAILSFQKARSSETHHQDGRVTATAEGMLGAHFKITTMWVLNISFNGGLRFELPTEYPVGPVGNLLRQYVKRVVFA